MRRGPSDQACSRGFPAAYQMVPGTSQNANGAQRPREEDSILPKCPWQLHSACTGPSDQAWGPAARQSVPGTSAAQAQGPATTRRVPAALADAGLFQYPPLVRVEVGSSVNLTCDIEDMIGKCFTVIWFKLRSKSIPTLETYQSIKPGGSFVGNEIEKTCSLNLSKSQVNDSGTYYCALISGPGMYTERSDDRAYIEILTPSESDGEVKSSGAATLVCLVFEVSEQARVYWVIEGEVKHKLTDSGSRDSSESTPDFIRNQITIAGEVWSSGAVCTCVVESRRNMSKSVSKTVADAGLFQYPPLVRAEVGSSVNLTCDIEDMTGKCFTVIWFKLRSKSIPTLETYQSIKPGGSFVGNEIEKTCSLNLSKSQVNDSGTYYCALISGPGMYTGNGSTLVVRVADAGLFQYPPLVRAEVGSSVNLTCDIEDMTGKCFTVIWFKLRSKSIPTLETYQCQTRWQLRGQRNRENLFLEPKQIAESDGEVQSSGAATLVCLVFEVSEQARVYWVIEGEVKHKLTDSGSRDSSESTPDFIRNQITIAGEVWSSGAVCTCVVESRRNMSKSVSKTGQCEDTGSVGRRARPKIRTAGNVKTRVL
ncbi:UNVERIFIED_CONTAM: hypothetical protein FKN15_048122 [Acipenser sinensis]